MKHTSNEISSAGTYRDLRDKVVLVTGGASGIGYAITQAFSANGSKVVVVGRDREKLESAKKEIGGKINSIRFDLNETDSLSDLVNEIRIDIGEVDVLVNNAGINLKKDALDVSNEEYENIVRTNQTAVFALTREVGKAMVARSSGSIIMISSMASQYGIPKVVAYTASKSAIEGMTRALAVEWSPHGVRVNCIAPGFIKTAMSSRALDNDSERKRKVLSRTPVGKLGEPSDVADAALFLASSQSKYITGVVLPVDGGNSIGF
ncbi:MAG TPA: SDR family oxidoreductase [Candidatus Acidoferrales bacterium]|nr:SDR family oxidoreductase [Candidatus Acidoferrales bacterium]